MSFWGIFILFMVIAVVFGTALNLASFAHEYVNYTKLEAGLRIFVTALVIGMYAFIPAMIVAGVFSVVGWFDKVIRSPDLPYYNNYTMNYGAKKTYTDGWEHINPDTDMGRRQSELMTYLMRRRDSEAELRNNTMYYKDTNRVHWYNEIHQNNNFYRENDLPQHVKDGFRIHYEETYLRQARERYREYLRKRGY